MAHCDLTCLFIDFFLHLFYCKKVLTHSKTSRFSCLLVLCTPACCNQIAPFWDIKVFLTWLEFKGGLCKKSYDLLTSRLQNIIFWWTKEFANLIFIWTQQLILYIYTHSVIFMRSSLIHIRPFLHFKNKNICWEKSDAKTVTSIVFELGKHHKTPWCSVCLKGSSVKTLRKYEC